MALREITNQVQSILWLLVILTICILVSLLLSATLIISFFQQHDNPAPQSMIDFYNEHTQQFENLVDLAQAWECTGICRQPLPADVTEWAGEGTMVVCKNSENTIRRLTVYIATGDYTYIPDQIHIPRGLGACSYGLQCTAKVADNWFICVSSNQ